MIYLGCSGWSYPDWVGPFYPDKATPKLDYYSKIFNTVEINTTFYRIPDTSMVTRWMKRVSNSDFRFSVKFPREVTHKDLMGDVDMAIRTSVDFESSHIMPMRDAERLAAVLIQLPPYFTIKNTHRLIRLLKALSTTEVNYFVEPRHDTLYGNEHFHGEVLDHGAEVVEIDGPEKEFNGISSRKNNFYVRFHGRNYALWNKKTSDSSDRYNYEYGIEEIRPFSRIIAEKLKEYADAFIYFNNHPQGKAPRNALILSELLGTRKRDPQSRLM